MPIRRVATPEGAKKYGKPIGGYLYVKHDTVASGQTVLNLTEDADLTASEDRD